VKIAYIFPGQGSQSVGMGKDLPNQDIFEKANSILGYDLRAICFNGPEEALKQTFNAQPAIFTVSYMDYILKEQKADMLAGHSLGEYTALCAAGVFSFEDGVSMVHLRGKLMEEAVPAGTGTMAAVLGMEEELLKSVCKQIGDVEIANYNCPGQLVISGKTDKVKICCEAITTQHGKKAILLPVSGPFHSSLMKPAADKFAKHLDKIKFNDPKIPVVMNVTADILKSAEQAKELLVKQLYSAVLWQPSVNKMVSAGIEEFVEVGPGKVLTGLIKKIRRG
jgi:[acyl-carrier-protein] S-malonyltransferase